MGRIFKGINILVSIFLVIAAGAVAYVAIPYFGNQALIVRSGSMQPTIDIGSIVVVHQQRDFVSPLAGAAFYKVGDIIAFRSESNSKTLITHRVASVETGENGIFYKTRGDANDSVDSWQVSPNNVLGKVYFILPFAGRLLAFAKSKVGFSLLIILPAALVILMEIFNVIKHIGNGKKNLGFSSAGLKLVIPLLAVGLAIPIAFAFSQDTETSANNIFVAASIFPTATPTPTPPIAQTLVINEVLPDTSCFIGQQEGQWIEVYNGFSTTVNLKNFEITDGTNTIDLVTSTTNISPGGFVLIAHSNAVWTQCYDDNNVTTANFGGQLDIDTEFLQLKDASNNIVDTVKWGSQTTGLDIVQNESIERDPDGKDTALGTNFAPLDFVIRSTPAPGS